MSTLLIERPPTAKSGLARERFLELPEDTRAEFINARIVAQKPISYLQSGIVGLIRDVISAFARTRDIGSVYGSRCLVRMTRNDYLPDLCFFPKKVADTFTKQQTIYPVPTFICEVVSKQTESRDRGVKFEDYAAHGVVEYWIVDPDKQIIEQYRNVDGEFELVKKFNAKKDAAGSIKSLAIKNFAMPVRAAFDEAANARALKRLWTKKK